jgi:alkylation response protein AidB-like acyl-CoA dehydrogenase
MDVTLEVLLRKVEEVANDDVRPRAESIDKAAAWPKQSLASLAAAGLYGLTLPKEWGGLGHRLEGLTLVCERLGQACASTALCFGMHCVASAVIAAKSPHRNSSTLSAIAAGKHTTTLALSETGTGSHFYFPQSRLTHKEDHLLISGAKQFVTNGSHADSYVVSVQSVDGAEKGKISCVLLGNDLPGMAWLKEWNGLGMRGNSSRSVVFESIRINKECLLGDEGDQNWFIFEVIAPFFLMAMAGTYLGIAQRALDLCVEHLRKRQYTHTGERLADFPLLQHRLADIWVSLEKSRSLVHAAARSADLQEPGSLRKLLASKADIADTAVRVTNEVMTLMGGIAYRENAEMGRLLRDARAVHVMSPTTDLLKVWLGRALLGLPILD